MELLFAVIGGVLVYALIVVLLGDKQKDGATVARRLREVENKKGSTYVSQRQEILEQPFFDRTILPLLTKIGKRMGKNKNGETQADVQLRRQLSQAGNSLHLAEYKALRLALTLIGLVLGLALAFISETATPMNKIIYVLFGAATPYIIMRYLLASQVTRRTNAIDHQLPEVLDLLSVTVEAGLGLEQAIEYLITQMDGPLIDEFAVTLREITMGRSRRSAFLVFGERCGTETVKSFVSILVQSIDMGISMRVLLSSQADSMRLHRRRVVEEKAMKLSTKLLFPLVIFIFPVIFIILLGPAFINIMQML